MTPIQTYWLTLLLFALGAFTFGYVVGVHTGFNAAVDQFAETDDLLDNAVMEDIYAD